MTSPLSQILDVEKSRRAEEKAVRSAGPLPLAALSGGQRNLLKNLSHRGLPTLVAACRDAGCSIGEALQLEERGLVATYDGDSLDQATKIGIRGTGQVLLRDGYLGPDGIYQQPLVR